MPLLPERKATKNNSLLAKQELQKKENNTDETQEIHKIFEELGKAFIAFNLALHYSNPFDYVPAKQLNLHAAIQAATKKQNYDSDNRFNELEEGTSFEEKVSQEYSRASQAARREREREREEDNSEQTTATAAEEITGIVQKFIDPLSSFCDNWDPTTSNYDTVRKILESENIGNVLNLADEQGNLPIHYAAADPNMPLHVLIRFKDLKAKLDKQNNAGELPLHVAIKSHNQAFVETFTKDSNLNHCTTKTYDNFPVIGTTPLHYAISMATSDAAEASVAILRMLLEEGCSLTKAQDKHGDTPLHLVMRHQDFDTLVADLRLQAYILKASKPTVTLPTQSLPLLNNNKKTIFHFAAANKHMSAKNFKRLLSPEENALSIPGKHLDFFDADRKTALHYAIEAKDEEKIKLLIEYGANPSAISASEPYSPFQRAILGEKPETIIMAFLSNQGQHKLRKEELTWALEHALLTGNDALLLILVRDFKAERKLAIALTTPNSTRRKSLFFATQSFHHDVELYQKVKNTKQLEDGDSVLHYAARHNLTDLATACIAQDPETIYAINTKKQTPANVAFSRREKDVTMTDEEKYGQNDVAKVIMEALNSQTKQHRQPSESELIRAEGSLRQLLFKEQKTNAATTKRTTETEQAFPFFGQNVGNAQTSAPAPEINPTKEQPKASPVNRHPDASQPLDETHPKMN